MSWAVGDAAGGNALLTSSGKFARRSGGKVLEQGMPEIVVFAAVGRTAEQKKALMKDITEAVVKNFGVAIDAVTVQIVEAPKENKAKGGVPFTER